VGGNSAEAMARYLDTGATMVTYGAMSKRPFSVPAGLYIFKDITFKGFWLSRWAKSDPEGRRSTLDAVLELMRQGKLKDVPVEEVKWSTETKEKELLEVLKDPLQGFRKGKGLFMFD
jgi:mitochondrial enoyl-[acyl-carrier protein] reductase / trans-2-enoyl-CoA reductase